MAKKVTLGSLSLRGIERIIGVKRVLACANGRGDLRCIQVHAVRRVEKRPRVLRRRIRRIRPVMDPVRTHAEGEVKHVVPCLLYLALGGLAAVGE